MKLPSYPSTLAALQALQRDLCPGHHLDWRWWLIEAALCEPEQCLCYMLRDPYPMRTTETDRRAALASLAEKERLHHAR